MQAQTTRTFGRNPIITTAIGIGALAVSLLGVATLSDSIELPSFNNNATTIERRVDSAGAAQSYSFREANLYHPGFDTQPAVRSVETARFLEANLIVPGFDSQAAVRPALETAFLELNLAMPEYGRTTVVLSAEEAAFVEMNTILHPGADQPVEVKTNQPS